MSAPVSHPDTGPEKKFGKALQENYEIYETADRLTQKPQDAHAGSSDWNFKYKVYHLPYTRQCSLFSIKI